MLALADLYKESFQALRQEAQRTSFYPGAREAVEQIDAAGLLLSAATGKSRRGLDFVLGEAGWQTLFLGTQTADDAPSKPHPQMVLNCLAATGVAPENAVMVGDTGFDMEMGRAAGCHVIGVDWGYHPRERLSAAGAETILEGFDQLVPALGRIWRDL